LGVGDCIDRLVPTCVDALTDHGVTMLAGGCAHTLALTCNVVFRQTLINTLDNGIVYSWGANFVGQCGYEDNGTKKQLTPKIIAALTSVKVISVSSYNGCHHCLALTDNNEVYAW
jgi:hypothetical protein